MPELKPEALASTTYRVEFDASKANLESVMAAVKEIVGRAGCPKCGRLSILDVRIDPYVRLEKEIAGVRGISEVIKATEVGPRG